MACRAILTCAQMGQELTIDLTSKRPITSSADMLALDTVYENGIYSIELFCDDYLSKDVKAISIFINDARINKINQYPNEVFVAGKCDKPESKADEQSFCFQPFLSQCDFVQLSFELLLDDETIIEYYSNYLLCISKNEEDNANIQSIMEDLTKFDNPRVENWLFATGDDKPNALRQGSWMHHAYKSYSSYLQLLADITICYRTNYILFKTHGRHTISKSNILLPYSKVKSVSIENFNWLMRNTDQLKAVQTATGIQHDGKCYIPTRMQSEVSENTWDIYENRIIVNFLYNVLTSAVSIFGKLNGQVIEGEKIIKKINGSIPKGYVAPIVTIKTLQIANMKRTAENLHYLINTLRQLMQQYASLFDIIPTIMVALPKKTKTFQEVKPYTRVFDSIIRWFQYGEYDSAKEDLLLHVKTLDKLFEYYCLVKLLDMFEKNGYEATNKPKLFPYQCNDTRFENENDIPNTYCLLKDEVSITLYYQPVIRTDIFQNDLHLYRVSYEKDNYWNPDFVIKCSKEGQDEYLLFDAKFAMRNTIKNNRLREIIQKYAIETAVARKTVPATSGIPKMVWALQGRIDPADPIWSLQKSRTHGFNLADTYRPISCGIVSINSLFDARPALWREIKKCIPWM